MFDAHTIYLVGFVSQIVFALTLALLAVSDRRTRGTGWFAAGCCLQLLMTSSRAILHNEREMIVASCGSCLLVLVFYFIYMGFRWFTIRQPLRSRTIPLATSGAMFFVLFLSTYSVGAGLNAARTVALVLMSRMVALLWRARIQAMQRLSRIVAMMIASLMVTLLLRMGIDLMPRSPIVDTLELLGRLATMVLATALSFSFVGFFVTETKRRLHDETRVDMLTGLRNRRSMEEVVAREVTHAAQYGSPLSLLVMDLDLFKKLNDTWGHAVGDRALEAVGSVLLRNQLDNDYTARLGGEEFAVLLPGTRMEDAATIAETIRRDIEAIRLEEGTHVARITVSVGVSSLRTGEQNWIDMLRRADKALYRAKHEGRNQVSVWCERDGVRGSRSDSRIRNWRRPWSSAHPKIDSHTPVPKPAQVEVVN